MLNFNFSELLVIGGVALMVLGPERLSEVAYKMGCLMRGFHQLNEKLKSELDHQFKQETLQHNLLRAGAVDALRKTHDTPG